MLFFIFWINYICGTRLLNERTDCSLKRLSIPNNKFCGRQEIFSHYMDFYWKVIIQIFLVFWIFKISYIRKHLNDLLVLRAPVLRFSTNFLVFIITSAVLFASNFNSFRIADSGLHYHWTLMNSLNRFFWKRGRIRFKIAIMSLFATGTGINSICSTIYTNNFLFGKYRGLSNRIAANGADHGLIGKFRTERSLSNRMIV